MNIEWRVVFLMMPRTSSPLQNIIEQPVMQSYLREVYENTHVQMGSTVFRIAMFIMAGMFLRFTHPYNAINIASHISGPTSCIPFKQI